MRLLIFILILLPVLAAGQTQQILGAKNTVVYNPGAFRCDSISILPITDTSVVRSAFPAIRKQGRIGWHNNILYIQDTGSWRNISRPTLADILTNGDTANGSIVLNNGFQTNLIVPAGIVMSGSTQTATYARSYAAYTTGSVTTTLEQNPTIVSSNTVMLPLSTGRLFTDADSGTIFVAPSQIPVAANPSNTITTLASSGSAATFMRSDAAPALSQSITPTWTQTHTWNMSSGSGGNAIKLAHDNSNISFFNGANTTRSGYLQIRTTGGLIGTDLATSFYIFTNGTPRLSVEAAGDVRLIAPKVLTFPDSILVTDADTIKKSAFLMTGRTYTPNITGTANVTSVTAEQCTYTRNGSIVTVYGSFDLTTTLAVATTLTISLPIASNLATANDLNGFASTNTLLVTNATIAGDATNDVALFSGTAAGAGSSGIVYFSFQYIIK